MKVLIDNGHGVETPGKCSPDGHFREYAYAREIAGRMVNRLRSAGNGSAWMTARGWSAFVDTTASPKSKLLATEIAKSKQVKIRQEVPTKLYWSSSLYICKHTNCPAVLIENFFQDNREDVDFLLSEAGKQCVTDIMVEGVINYKDTI